MVSAFSWMDIEAIAASASERAAKVLDRLRSAGLDAVAEVPLDRIGNAAEVVDALAAAGYEEIRLTIEKAPADARVKLCIRAAALQDRCGCIRSMNPLPSLLDAMRPT